MTHARRPAAVIVLLAFFLATGSLAPRAAAQAPREVTGRFAATGAFQAGVFVDGAGSVDDAQLAAFAAALQNLTLTFYSDDRFDLQSASGGFALNVLGGRIARAGDGSLFLHFGAPPAVALTDTLDGVFYPALPGPVVTPPRLSFTLAQIHPATRVRLTWHGLVTLRSLDAR